MNTRAQGAVNFNNVGAVQGAETVSTADLLQAMSLVQHELEQAEVRAHGHGRYALTLRQRKLCFREVMLYSTSDKVTNLIGAEDDCEPEEVGRDGAEAEADADGGAAGCDWCILCSST